MKRKLIYILILLMGGFIFVDSKGYNYSSYLPRVEKDGGELTVSIETLKAGSDFYIYYRTDGIRKYQIRKMRSGKDGKIYYQLPIANLYGKNIEYFIVEDGAGVSDSISPVFTIKNFTEADSPEVYFLQTDPGVVSSKKKRKPFSRIVKVNGSLSSTTRLYDNQETKGQSFTATGNMGLGKNIAKEKYEFDFRTDFTYMDPTMDNEDSINMTSMKIRYKRKSHTVEMGDLSISNTEFTTSYLNRRGFHYEFNSERFYLSSFYTNSQQKTGFDGFGIPGRKANILGATGGVNVGQNIKLRVLLMTGKDDLDSKTVVSSEEKYREGSLYSFWGEFNLLKNRLQLRGEYTESDFGKGESSDGISKAKDSAWRAGFNYNYKIFSADANYKKIGNKFNSIANLFLQNDNEGLASNIRLNIKTFSFHVGYMDRKNYINNPEQPMLHSRNIQTDFNWFIKKHFKVGAEVSLDNLDYDKSTHLQTGGSDMDTLKYAATFGYIAGNNGVNIRLGKSESKSFTSNIDGSLAVNLRFGKILSLNPTISYQSTKNIPDNSTSKIYNYYLNSEVTFIPEIFTLSISGSYSETKNTHSDSMNLSVGANLNFFMSKIFKNKVQPSLSIRSKYVESKYGTSPKTSFTTVYLQADVSF